MHGYNVQKCGESDLIHRSILGGKVCTHGVGEHASESNTNSEADRHATLVDPIAREVGELEASPSTVKETPDLIKETPPMVSILPDLEGDGETSMASWLRFGIIAGLNEEREDALRRDMINLIQTYYRRF